jgi:DnaJ-class molecular chaperone
LRALAGPTGPGIPGITKTKHKINTTMKKKLIIASIIAAITATAAYAGFKCNQCNGTGWKGQSRCQWCGGDGETGN